MTKKKGFSILPAAVKGYLLPTLGWKTVLCRGVVQTIPLGFCTWDYLQLKHSLGREKRKIRIVREFIFKSLHHANNTKEVVKNLTTMTCHRHYQHQEGRLAECRTSVNARNTNK
jgi:hypothetical protein